MNPNPAIERLTEKAHALLEVLRAENTLLKNPQSLTPEALQAIADQKGPLLEQLSELEGIPQEASETQKAALQSLLESAQELNQRNGISLNFLLTNTQRTLQILHGQDPDVIESQTYAPKNKKTGYISGQSLNRRNISKA
jgi:flagellar biosynthesis/type III secretory pathway chaperone